MIRRAWLILLSRSSSCAWAVPARGAIARGLTCWFFCVKAKEQKNIIHLWTRIENSVSRIGHCLLLISYWLFTTRIYSFTFINMTTVKKVSFLIIISLLLLSNLYSFSQFSIASDLSVLRSFKKEKSIRRFRKCFFIILAAGKWVQT